MGPNDDPIMLDYIVQEILQEIHDQYYQEANEDAQVLDQAIQDSEQGEPNGS